jgi:hypothetical protein
MTRLMLGMILACGAMLSIAAAVSAADADVTTQPLDAAPTTQPAAVIQKWFDDLASSEPAAREAARTALLGMTRPELETLREVVKRSTPLAPAQASVLHDVVTHVFLASEAYETYRDPPMGFLGVMLDSPDGGVQNSVRRMGAGVYVFDCMPGFAGFRWLRPGDIVGGVVSDGKVRPFLERTDLQTEVSTTLPGKVLRLQVLRQGRTFEVTVRVDARPQAAPAMMTAESVQKFQEWRNQRYEAAEAYWTRTFASIAGAMLSSTQSGPFQ